MHMVTASDHSAAALRLSAGNRHDSLEGGKLLEETKRPSETLYLIMDRAYEGDRTSAKGLELGYIPVVPPKQTAKNHGHTTVNCIRNDNEIERFSLRLKSFRRVFTRYDKLGLVFGGLFAS